VRVFEQQHPLHAKLSAKALTCDGAPLPGPVELESRLDGVHVAERVCARVDATGEVTVTVGDVTRRYPGALSATVDGVQLKLLNELDVEAYLPSVVTGELAEAPPAALQAQAVVSRTFALGSRHRHGASGYDVCDLTHCQLYRGEGDVTREAREAVKATAGQVLLVGGVVLRSAFFHAACGGHTSRAAEVFGVDAAGAAVSDVKDGKPLCAAAPDFAWEWTVEREPLAEALGVSPSGPAFEVLRRDEAARVVEVRAFGHRFTGTDFQARVGRVFGWRTLKSLKLAVEQTDTQLHFTGTGLGHGVGLCQQGARALALQGASVKQVLEHYFPDATLGRAPSP
jgi:stage II sporulation protein D